MSGHNLNYNKSRSMFRRQSVKQKSINKPNTQFRGDIRL